MGKIAASTPKLSYMIFVLLGTFPLTFPRPLVEIEKLIQTGVITDEVIVQSGHTPFQSDHMKIIPFMPLDELLSLYQRADLIITQAGTGSIIKGLKLNKKMIAIARLAKLGEHVDDHQSELIKEFSECNFLLPWSEQDQLADILEKIADFKPQVYKSENKAIVNYLIDYIDNV
ncbi:PssE/Cps14G family polysaccharide biosynthesis glycosyltransferase [Algoriphagus sp. NG3]|uniref:PssE/Cps14G family polysaccharide biosynthesis glycosyltransferase n=1 Tax=Algoriphagus sp. NG3 TaxID=3097546 RepID=UPI002A7FE164|nr:PssE/Cps14G family polysaccharide biosynthesis glycosyltransferase [Algoriphagus sp. NG3]WPR73537.1 PssE/Cps14G family polysaccharide biosynthesis glycosyltransferase [Algoriphagus sp. NG3]